MCIRREEVLYDMHECHGCAHVRSTCVYFLEASGEPYAALASDSLLLAKAAAEVSALSVTRDQECRVVHAGSKTCTPPLK